MKYISTAIEENDALFQRLRALRKRVSEKETISPYIVFSDATLKEMSARSPQNLIVPFIYFLKRVFGNFRFC